MLFREAWLTGNDEFVEEQSVAFSDPQDLRVEMRVKNNVLWHAIYDTYDSVQVMCRKHRVLKTRATVISELLRFKKYPFKKKSGLKTKCYGDDSFYSNEYISTCLLLERILKFPAEDLFPRHLYDHLIEDEATKVLEINLFSALSTDMKRIVCDLLVSKEEGPEKQVESMFLSRAIEVVLKTLRYREREVIKLRFGLGDGFEYTLEEVGRILKLNKETVRRIEVSALQKLQHPVRLRYLASF